MRRVAKFGLWKKHKRASGSREGFDSPLEYNVGAELAQRKEAGEITEIRRQVDFPMVVNGIKICTYRADYYVTFADGTEGVYEPKGIPFQMGEIKLLLFEALYPHIKLTVVRR